MNNLDNLAIAVQKSYRKYKGWTYPCKDDFVIFHNPLNFD
jgi:hypothetical protein